mmetsp:Transcript_18451/g.25929  ORF Transcript_18451/g.25929 Transcript_18451/m.25929 type:complete len:581 (-) Transcript_18451:400-2142(-)
MRSSSLMTTALCSLQPSDVVATTATSSGTRKSADLWKLFHEPVNTHSGRHYRRCSAYGVPKTYKQPGNIIIPSPSPPPPPPPPPPQDSIRRLRKGCSSSRSSIMKPSLKRKEFRYDKDGNSGSDDITGVRCPFQGEKSSSAAAASSGTLREFRRIAWATAAIAVVSTFFESRADMLDEWEGRLRNDDFDVTGFNTRLPPWDKRHLMESSEDEIVITKENGTGRDFSEAPEDEDIGWVYTVYEDMEGDTSSEPMGLTLGIDNQTVYFTDRMRNQVKKITPDGGIHLVAGHIDALDGYKDGIATASFLWYPNGITIDNKGYIYVCDGYNYVVRRISIDEKEIITFAGSGLYGHRDGAVEYMMFRHPIDAVSDNKGRIYIADQLTYDIRRISKDRFSGLWIGETIIGSPLTSGFKDGYGAMFQDLYSLIRSPIDGTFYTSCRNYDRRIRKLQFHFLFPEKSQSWTIAGQSFPLGHVDGLGPLALFRSVSGMAIDHSNNIYLSDIGNNVVRKISSDGEVTTVVGDGRYIDEYANADFFKVEGPSRKVSLSGPNGIAVAPDRSLYIADTGARRIIKVVPNDAGWV